MLKVPSTITCPTVPFTTAPQPPPEQQITQQHQENVKEKLQTMAKH